jgi:hypothetical protein
MPHVCEFYPGICLTTEERAWKNLSQGKKNLSQSTVYILPKHTHTLQNNIKPPQYKLKQTQYKITQMKQWQYNQIPAVKSHPNVHSTFIHKNCCAVLYLKKYLW